jgi:hypothetical protein
MNYQKIYDLLIESSKNKIKTEGYTEKHHILPRSLGGDDDPSNIIVLSAREHFIAHLLLAKIYGGPMITAAYLMSSRKQCTNRKYDYLRTKFSNRLKEDTQRSLKISKSLTGKSKSKKHKEAYKQSRLLKGGWIVSDLHKSRISNSMIGSKNHMYGKTHNKESRRIISEANRQRITCPHCNKNGGITAMRRWHFDNCK